MAAWPAFTLSASHPGPRAEKLAPWVEVVADQRVSLSVAYWTWIWRSVNSQRPASLTSLSLYVPAVRLAFPLVLETAGLQGTPAYLVGPFLYQGGLDDRHLAQAVMRARKSGPPT